MVNRFVQCSVAIILSLCIITGSVVPAYAEEETVESDISSTIPVEYTQKSSTTNLLQGISEGDPFHNLTDYLGYKNITEKDLAAIKWSFVLSQMAEPLEQSLEDVLKSKIVTQMREQDLSISSQPDATDKDYTYEPLGSQTGVSVTEFGEVYDTLSKNIRYNRLWDKVGNQYTVKTFYDTTQRKANVGYVSDFIYTNSGAEEYKELSGLRDKIDTLYEYDSQDKASNVIDYWKNPEKLITDNGSSKVIGQRRLISVFVGSNITDFYLQLGVMSFCKNHSEMNYQKFIDNYGNCEIWADSFGNILLYDSSVSKYKMILPNACNPVFTSTSDTKEEQLFPNEYIDAIDELGGDITEIASTGYTSDDLIDQDASYTGWSEKNFIYNKWLGAFYSTKRRTSMEKEDPRVYHFDNKDDLNEGYYPAYLGPLVDSRIDVRNSVVIVDPVDVFISPDVSMYSNPEDTVWNRIKEFFVNTSVGAISIPMTSEQEPSVYQNINPLHLDIGSYLPMSTVLFNTVLREGAKTSRNSEEGLTPEAVYTMFTMAQSCSALLTQTADDTVLPSISSMNLLHEQGGGVAQYVYTPSLVDITNEELMGEEGGFLEDSKNIILEGRSEVIPSWLDALGNVQPPVEVDIKDTDYSAKFLVKRDNRISNRYKNYPSDDIAVLSYIWNNDYFDKTIFSTFYTEGEERAKVRDFLVESGSSEEYIESYALLPFNLGSTDGYKLTTCMIPLQNANDAGNFYEALDSGSSVSETPCTNSAEINPYSLLMGLYRNTDTQYNPNIPVDVLEVQKEVDIAELAHKVDYSIGNPITVLSNWISGLAQYIHSVIGVRVSTNYSISSDSTMYKQIMDVYVTGVLIIAVLVLLSTLIRVVLNRTSAIYGVRNVILVSVLVCCVPIVFNLTQELNRFVVSSLSESAVDKTTLISVEKTIQSLVNTEAKPEKRWQAYRQQFSEIEQVFDDGYIEIPTGFNTSGVVYERKDIDALVRSIKYLGAGAGETSNDNNWYKVPYEGNVYPLLTRYDEDPTKYFYDNLLGSYMNYFNDKVGTDQGLIISQYKGIPQEDAKETTEITDRLDRILHTLKGGYSVMLKDTEYINTHDVFGVAKFFNQPVTEGVNNLEKYLPVTFVEMKKNEKLAPKVTRGSQRLEPWTTEGLSIATKGERDKFAYMINNTSEWKTKPTYMEEKIVKINKDIQSRVSKLVKYRSGEFSDTSLMYMTAIITMDELNKQLGDVTYSMPATSDNDKMLRLVYSKDTEDIYNTEAIMYIIQDSVGGGAVLTIVLVVVELLMLVVNLISIFTCVVIAVLMPLLIYKYFDGVNSLYKMQMFGVLSQLLLNLSALLLVNLPLTIGSWLANDPISDFGLWVFTIVALMIDILAAILSFKLFRLLFKDIGTCGGYLIASGLSTAMDRGDFSISDVEMSSEGIMLNTTNAEMSIENSESVVDRAEQELMLEESQGDNPYEYEEPQLLLDDGDEDDDDESMTIDFTD